MVLPLDHTVIRLKLKKEGCVLLVSWVPKDLCPLLAERWVLRQEMETVGVCSERWETVLPPSGGRPRVLGVHPRERSSTTSRTLHDPSSEVFSKLKFPYSLGPRKYLVNIFFTNQAGVEENIL